MSLYLLSGFALVVLTGIAFSRKSKQGIRIWSTASASASCIHYASTGLWTPTGISTFGVLSNWILGKRDSTKNVPISFLFLFLGINATIVTLTWQGWTSLLPAIAGMTGISAIYLKTPRATLTAKLCIEPIWLFYNFHHNLWFAFAASLALISGCTFRLYILLRTPETKFFQPPQVDPLENLVPQPNPPNNE